MVSDASLLVENLPQKLLFISFEVTSHVDLEDIFFVQSNAIGEVLSRVIRVELNGEFVGYAYCFTEKILVSAG